MTIMIFKKPKNSLLYKAESHQKITLKMLPVEVNKENACTVVQYIFYAIQKCPVFLFSDFL